MNPRPSLCQFAEHLLSTRNANAPIARWQETTKALTLGCM
jgi:hypothetical protein